MRPDCVSACIDFGAKYVTYMEIQMDRQSDGGSQNTFVDHLIQYRISPWQKSVEKRGFRAGVTDGRTDGRTDGPTDRPSYRDAFLTDASRN